MTSQIASIQASLESLFLLPVRDYLEALQAGFHPFRLRAGAAFVLALIVSWWAYVPVHELAHAYGCILAGGEVTRLEIDAAYGAAVLQAVFPFVAVGSEYAGQLTGFDTRESDLIFLATDFAPFLFTIFLGVPLLRRAGRCAGRPLIAALHLGVAVPIAYAPFISLTGDFYEMGSIIVSRIASSFSSHGALPPWRSDDLFKLTGQLAATGGGWIDAVGVGASLLVGIALAFATYAAGHAWANYVAAVRARS